MSEPIIKIEKLKKYFPVTKGLLFAKTIGWLRAVDEITFSIHRGETLALVGESGCGKTTTIKLVLLLLRPTTGSIWFGGENILEFRGDKLKQYRRSVQSVFQDPFSSLNPRMRVGSIVSQPIVVHKALSGSAIKERVQELLLQVGLDSQASARFPHEFSGGQRQRIAVARALALRPKLVALDEPVSALDVSIRAQVMNLLKDLQVQLGVSYLLVAHNLATVRYMSHRIAIMYLGRIVELAPTKQLFTNPLHPYTQALISASLSFHPDFQGEEKVLPGEVPSPINIPPGCRFHPRCFRAQEICSVEDPPLMEVETEHQVACRLACPEKSVQFQC